MSRGGKRPGTGRKSIEGKEYRIKIEDSQIEQLELFFEGNTVSEKIRTCLDYGIKKIHEKQPIMKDSYTVLDLFSGAGGLSKGFMDAGFNVVLGVDFDDAALKTFKANHGHAEAMKLDLFNHSNVNKLKEFLDIKDIKLDVLVGGPPCQGFSLAGKREELDERNLLYSAMVKTAELLKPKVVVLENVPGLLTLYKGKAKQQIINDFKSLGYKMDVQVLYAPNYGVPQIRKRAFFVGILTEGEYNFNFPIPYLDENNYINCEQAVSDLPSLAGCEDYSLNVVRDYSSKPKSDYQQMMRSNSIEVYNHIPTRHEEKTIKLISMVPEGKNYKALPPEFQTGFKYNESLTRYHSKKPSRTIDTGHRTHFHYKWPRIPTVRENARFQSFPDDFIFYGNKQQQYKQVGNAVPPLLGKALAKQVKELLENE
ncbi:DNA cytosine methyltransferase [Rossellomorea arthrocnemi]